MTLRPQNSNRQTINTRLKKAFVANSKVEDLLNVDKTDLSDGDVLVFDEAEDEWEARSPNSDTDGGSY